MSNELLTHKQEKMESLDTTVERVTQRIKETGALPYVTVEKQLSLLNQLITFPLGRYLLQNQGLNGYWTHYVVTHPQNGRITGMNSEGKSFTFLEQFMLDKAPHMLATQQRFNIFQQNLQGLLKKSKTFASIPCGLMADLLTLDFSQTRDVQLTGFDLDSESLDEAKKLANQLGILDKTKFLQENAWGLTAHESFDVITSNGLNNYEPSDERVVDLYKKFHQALVYGGVLVTSTATPFSANGNNDTWDMTKTNYEDLIMEKIVMGDIVAPNWQSFRTVDQTHSQLTEAGFSEIEVHYDIAHMIPTIIAKKK